MSMSYIREYYGVPAKRGGRVEIASSKFGGALKRGTITSADHYVYVRIDGMKHSRPYHPTDLTYLADDA